MSQSASRAKRRLFTFLYYLISISSAIIIIVPIIFIFLSSFKTESEIFSSPWSFPKEFSFDTYIEIFLNYNMGNYFCNSIFYAVTGCAICLLLTFPASYAICRMRWKFSRLAMSYLASGLMIPIHAILVPLYIFISRTHIPNKIALVFIYAASTMPTALFLFVGNLKSLPISMEEAAVIDGCSVPAMLIRIVLPLSKSVGATVTVFSFLNIWNDLMLALVFLSNELEKTVQVGIMRFMDTYFTNYGYLLSAIIVAIVPTVILFAFLSRQIVGGLTAGAIKE